MNRAGVLTIVLAAAIAGACGGADSASPSPTAPSSPSAPSQPQAPASCVPTNLRVASLQGTVVRLEWNSVSGATEYTVLVGSTPGSSDQLSTNTTNPNYTWTARTGRQYARVQAKCNGVYGSSSNEVEFTAGNGN